MTTEGEKAFIEYCNKNRISCKKIPETSNSTPDFYIQIDDTQITVEIKDFEENEVEKKAIKELDEKQSAGWSNGPPGKRIRYKIESAKKQLKNSVNPTILVLFDTRSTVVSGINEYDLKVGMYGLETLHLEVPNDFSSPRLMGKSFGKGSKLRSTEKNYISAIAILLNGSLTLYHNIFAEKPICRLFQNVEGTTEYILPASSENRNFGDWIKL